MELFQGYTEGLKTFTIIRDHFTGESRQFALMTFGELNQAEAFVETFNFKRFRNFELIVSLKKNPQE